MERKGYFWDRERDRKELEVYTTLAFKLTDPEKAALKGKKGVCVDVGF